MTYQGEGVLAVLYYLTIEYHAHLVYNSLNNKGGLSKKDSTGLSDILVIVDELSAHQLSIEYLTALLCKDPKYKKMNKLCFKIA
jgi:hypothetical protein